MLLSQGSRIVVSCSSETDRFFERILGWAVGARFWAVLLACMMSRVLLAVREASLI